MPQNPPLTTATATLTALLALGPGALSQEIVLYDGAHETHAFLDGDDQRPGGFTFGDFDRPAFADGPDAWVIHAHTDVDGQDGVYGGVGRDVNAGATLDPNFDPAAATATVTFRTVGEQAGAFRLVLQDGAHQFQYDLNLEAAEPAGGGFLTATIPLGAGDPADADDDQIVYVGTLDGSPGPMDAVPAYGLTQWQLQAEFGTPDPVHIEVRRIAINDLMAMPEPG